MANCPEGRVQTGAMGGKASVSQVFESNVVRFCAQTSEKSMKARTGMV